jgi:hypothetical protein
MTRAEVLARYRPLRAGIRRVLRAAMDACGRADLNRAVKQVAPWAGEEDLQGEEAAEMLADVALFEPNQRGRRAFDRFLAEEGERLGAADRALAERMAGAWFSLFRAAGRHEAAGLWLEDMLAGAGASGSWTRPWRRPRPRASYSACACSTRGRSTPGSASSRSQMRR